MFKNTVKGFNKLLQKDIPPGSIIIVSGTHGTLKSGFVHNLMSNYLQSNNECGVYATFEESKESHIRNMESLGIKKPDNLHIFDYGDLGKNVEKAWRENKFDIEKLIGSVIRFYKLKFGKKFTVFALDSMNSLYALLEPTRFRKQSCTLLNTLRESGLTSFIIVETPAESEIYGPLYFLADGVFTFGKIERQEAVIRYLQIEKLRAAEHSMKKHQLVVEKDGIAVLGSAYEK
jgi:KaiC/GvpD/RAD55 family RecA-like ATPase